MQKDVSTFTVASREKKILIMKKAQCNYIRNCKDKQKGQVKTKHNSCFTWKDAGRRGCGDGDGDPHTATSTVLPTAAPTAGVASPAAPAAATEIRATET